MIEKVENINIWEYNKIKEKRNRYENVNSNGYARG